MQKVRKKAIPKDKLKKILEGLAEIIYDKYVQEDSFKKLTKKNVSREQ